MLYYILIVNQKGIMTNTCQNPDLHDFGMDSLLESYHSLLIHSAQMAITRHNHPPMTGLKEGCPYCDTYGNAFKNGVIPFSKSKFGTRLKN